MDQPVRNLAPRSAALLSRLSALLLLMTGALPGDVCQGLAPAPSDHSKPAIFRLPVKPGGPSFRITIRTTPLMPQPVNHFVHSGDIEVARCADGGFVQSLALTAWQPADQARSFHADDVNFDGYLDFAVLAESGGAWGSEWWWVYDPAAGRLVQNELTRELKKIKAGDISIDAAKKEILARHLTEPWGCGSTIDRYQVAGDRLILVHKENPKPAPDACTVTVSDLKNGALRVTNIRRFAGGKQVN